MASLAWGGHANGKIPAGALMRVPWQTYHSLRTDACLSLIALNVRYRARFGENIYLTDGYREYAVQEKIFRDRYVRGVAQGTGDARWWQGGWWYRRKGTASASVPGLSNHGWALAVDLGDGVNDERHERHKWMRENAPAVGWIHPTWAHDNIPSNGSEEPWHFEYPRTVIVPGTPATQPEEYEDVVTPQDRTAIAQAAADAVIAALGGTVTAAANSAAIAATHAEAATLAAAHAGERAQAAETLTAAVLAAVEADPGAVQLRAQLENLRARMPRASSATYGRPGCKTYQEIADAAVDSTYVELSGQIAGARPAIVADAR